VWPSGHGERYVWIEDLTCDPVGVGQGEGYEGGYFSSLTQGLTTLGFLMTPFQGVYGMRAAGVARIACSFTGFFLTVGKSGIDQGGYVR
jgi:hypothetical protein